MADRFPYSLLATLSLLVSCGTQSKSTEISDRSSQQGHVAEREAPAHQLPPGIITAIDAQAVSASRSTLLESLDRTALEAAAISLARSPLEAAHLALHEVLTIEGFYLRLDSEDDYRGTAGRLRLYAVIVELGQNPATSAQELLFALVHSDPFQSHVLRIQTLIHALAFVSPSPTNAIEFLRAKSQPGSPLSYDVFEALVVNQSATALALAAELLLDERIDRFEKQDWLRQTVAPRRHALPLLIALEKILQGAGPEQLKTDIVQALYNDQPEEWSADEPVAVPARGTGSKEATLVLSRIAQRALLELPLDAEWVRLLESYAQ